MKFNFVFLLISIILISKYISCDDKPPVDFSSNFNNDKNELKKSDSDFELEKIRNEVLTLAVDNMKSESKAKKGKANGAFGNFANKFLKNKGKQSRKDKKLWGFMNDPQEVYQFCVFPTYKVNFKKWCENSYLGKPVKLNGKYFFNI